MEFSGKTIVVLSPQAWGPMRISKHHYALELARNGSRVFFLNPPQPVRVPLVRTVVIRPCSEVPSLFIVDHTLGVPRRMRARLPWVFRAWMCNHVRALLARVCRPVDIVWSFDLDHLYPLPLFGPDPIKIFHPVDEFSSDSAIAAAEGADVILSVTHEILDKYQDHRAPKHLINHGVSEAFLRAVACDEEHTGIRVGVSGNLLRPDIDHAVFVDIIRRHPEVTFELWGNCAQASNVGGVAASATQRFVGTLSTAPNVRLHGAVSNDALAAGYRRMDAFLICYDVQRDPSHGTNYHKVMEFLATGKVLISNNITAYSSRPDLVQMVSERKHNRALPELFASVIEALHVHNAPDRQEARRSFAASNTYEKQLERVAAAIRPLLPASLRRPAKPVPLVRAG